jgi:hypothetical protein
MVFTVGQLEQLVLPFSVVIVYVTLALAARPDRDDQGNGLYAFYLGLVSLVSLYVLLVFGANTISAVGELVLVDHGGLSTDTFDNSGVSGVYGLFFSSSVGSEEEAAGFLVLAGAFVLAAALVFTFHLRRRQELAASPGYDGSAAERGARAYGGAVAFMTVLLGVLATVFVGDALYRMIAEPTTSGVTRAVVRDRATIQLIAFGALLVTTLWLFRAHFWAIRGAGADTGDAGGDDDLVEMGD